MLASGTDLSLEATELSGYLHPAYAGSLAEFGVPRELPRSKGWILERPIPGSDSFDAMGCYPLFTCRDWSSLEKDLDELRGGAVSLSVVTDPFGVYTPDLLRRCFRDVVAPFKEHYVVDFRSGAVDSFVCDHHRRNARRALQEVEVERCPESGALAGEWSSLYINLIERHQIKGISAFSEESFKRQLRVPGMAIFRAMSRGETVGMTLWYVQGDVGYYHLGAYSQFGYELRASFALFWRALEYFAQQGVCLLNLGAGAGISSDGQDGLTRFKQGWSTGTRTAYFCGRVFDQSQYARLIKLRAATERKYFPAYRAGEFG